MFDVTEIDYTGPVPVVTERLFTDEEVAQRSADAAMAAAQAALEIEQAKARADAIKHAKSLGFTDAMIAVMYPNLVEA